MQPRAVSGPFKLDENLIAEIEKDWTRVAYIKQTQFPEIDFSLLNEPPGARCKSGFEYPKERLNHLMTKSPQRPQSANVSLYSVSSPQHFSPSSVRPATAPEADFMKMSSPKLDTKLLNLIKGIGHPDRLVSHASLNEVADIMESQEKQAVLRDYDEIYIESVLEQFKVGFLRSTIKIAGFFNFLISSIFHNAQSPKLSLFINRSSQVSSRSSALNRWDRI